MASSGVLGRPEEFFWEPDETAARAAQGLADDAAYFDWVIERGTSRNGVFSCKLQLGERNDLVTRIGALHGRDADGRLIARLFPDPRYVWLRRRDRVAQAVSWARALQTLQWRTADRPQATPAFDADQIDGLIRLIDAEDDAWASWFADQGVTPLEVAYEDLVADRRAAIAAVASFADVRVPPEARLRSYPGWRQQSDVVNADWIRRYTVERSSG